MAGQYLIQDVQIEFFGRGDPPEKRGYIIADYRNAKRPRYVGKDGKWVDQPIRVAETFPNLEEASRIENLTKEPAG